MVTWWTCVVLAAAVMPAAGQVSVEAGVHAGSACVNGGTGCAGAFVGPYVGLDLRRQVVVRVRHFTVDIDERSQVLFDILIREHSRRGQFTLGEVLYAFRRRAIVQPFVGISVGRRVYRQVTVCAPVSCDEARTRPNGGHPGVYGGTLESRRLTVGGVGGLMFRAGERLTI